MHPNISAITIYWIQYTVYHWKTQCLLRSEQKTLCIITSQDLMPAMNAGLRSHRPGKFWWCHFEYFNFKQLRSAFIAGIKPCDVITHKVNPCFTLCTLHTCKIIWNMKGIVHLLSIFKIHVVIGGNCTSATFWFCDLLVAGLLHMNRFWRVVGAIVIMSCVGHNHVFDMW
jgi:hypothetical protein